MADNIECGQQYCDKIQTIRKYTDKKRVNSLICSYNNEKDLVENDSTGGFYGNERKHDPDNC